MTRDKKLEVEEWWLGAELNRFTDSLTNKIAVFPKVSSKIGSNYRTIFHY